MAELLHDPSVDIEVDIQLALAADDRQRAATLALERYGPALYGYLMSRAQNDQDAAEIFSEFCEDFWLGLPNFRGESSMRTWAYRLARNALALFYRTSNRAQRRQMPLSVIDELSRISMWVRTNTRPYLKTETKTWVTRIRSELAPAERELLTLHIDHQLTFGECAQIMLDQSGEGDVNGLRQLEQALRKRYQRTREKIRQLAERDGLLSDEDA